MNTRIARLAVLSGALGMCLAGCNSGSREVAGRVLAGKVGVVTIVDPDDERLTAPGLGDVQLRLTPGGGSASSIAQTVSQPDGSFTMLVDDRYFYNRVELTATGPNILICRGSLYLPGDGRVVLVLVEPEHSDGVGEQPR